jgi:hypothetical protein
MDLILVGALVVGITQLFKIGFGTQKKYIPMTALIISIVLFALYIFTTKATLSWEMVTNCLMVALSSVGLYSGIKSSRNK